MGTKKKTTINIDYLSPISTPKIKIKIGQRVLVRPCSGYDKCFEGLVVSVATKYIIDDPNSAKVEYGYWNTQKWFSVYDLEVIEG